MSALLTILDMISLVIGGTITTTARLGELFSRLLVELGVVSAGGPTALVISGLTIVAVTFFIAKFIIGAGKMLLFLLAAGGLILVALLFAL